jgi:thioester reductase-like protein
MSQPVDHEPPVAESVLITGFPCFAARRMAARILAADPGARLRLLVSRGRAAEAQAFLQSLPADHGARMDLVIGRARDMDLGLAGDEYGALAADITTIHHLAGIDSMDADAATARRVSIGGTREILELAGQCKQLRRLCHWSTAAVSGKRRGIITEDELDHDQGFHNAYERARYQAEKLARHAQRRLPITIFRPGVIVGDSRTGEVHPIKGSVRGPYSFMVLIASNQTQVGLPLPGRGAAPLNLVPVDYVVEAAYALSLDERAAGKTFHLTDPHPLSARRIFELVAERSGTPPPRGYIPGKLSRAVMRVPGLDRLVRGQRSFVDSFDQQVFYDCRGTRELLAGAGIECPPFETYVDNLVRYIQQARQARRSGGPGVPGSTDDEHDALD